MLFRKNQAVNLQTNKGKMTQRLRIFLVVLLLIFYGEIFSQKNISNNNVYLSINYKNLIPGLSFNDLVLERKFSVYKAYYGKDSNIERLLENTKKSPSLYYNLFRIPVYKSQSIVCNAEYKFERQTSIPLRLRLGSLEYTNYLEQKPNAIKPN